MRILPLLMLTLLLIGFASRPTVAAAWSSGQVLLHPCQVVSGVVEAPQVAPQPMQDSQATVTHCVSLGILPPQWLAVPRLGATLVPLQTTSGVPNDRAYGLLRPPQA